MKKLIEFCLQVEKIIDHRLRGRATEYKVRWVGFGPRDDTWLPEDSLNCPKLIAKYNRAVASKPEKEYEVLT